MEVMAEAKVFAAEEGWRVLDQHYDDNGLLAHEATVRELMRDCPGVTDVVCTTGTGATAAGLRRFLPEHIRVHARPGTQPWTSLVDPHSVPSCCSAWPAAACLHLLAAVCAHIIAWLLCALQESPEPSTG